MNLVASFRVKVPCLSSSVELSGKRLPANLGERKRRRRKKGEGDDDDDDEASNGDEEEVEGKMEELGLKEEEAEVSGHVKLRS